MQDMTQLAQDITVWIKDQVDEAGASGIVVGMSGGVDSAVVAVLAKRAVGRNVLGLLMPCGSSPADEADALLAAGELGIETAKVDLEPVLGSLLGQLPEGPALAVANLKPRLRMTTLYYFAGKLDYLVAGTGNRSEAEVGYFTKYGDGGVDILPIGGLFKTDVWKLAEALGVPEKIRSRVPSAGLWEDQTDEGEMGVSYAELDSILAALDEGREAQCRPGALKRVKDLVRASEHKRVRVPVFWPKRADRDV